MNCGFVAWATAETCKKCGAQLSESQQIDIDPIDQTPGRAKHIRIVLAVIALLALSAAVFAFKNSGSDRVREFVLKDGSKKSSKTWFHSWLSSDPSVDEIVAQYLKVSGWDVNPSALKSFAAKGRFEIKKEPSETILETRDAYRIPVHLHWYPQVGEVEFESEAPDKIVITQKFDGGLIWQRGTNGTIGWSRKGLPDKSAEVDPHIRLEYPLETGEVRAGQLTDLKSGAEFINYFQLPNKYPRMYLSGKTLVGDRVAYELTNRNYPDVVEAMYFDVETGMLLKFWSYRLEDPYIPAFDGYILPYREGTDVSEIYLEDYREVNGVKLPFLIRQYFRKYWITTAVTDLKVNVEIDPSVFEKP